MDDLEFLIGSGRAVPNESEETMRPRRNHKPAFKAKRALAAFKGGRTPAQPAEQFDVHPTRSIELDQSAIAIIGEEQPASLSAELHVHQNGDHVADAAVEQACTEQHDPGLPPAEPKLGKIELAIHPLSKAPHLILVDCSPPFDKFTPDLSWHERKGGGGIVQGGSGLCARRPQRRV